jgi:hypothetical protein
MQQAYEAIVNDKRVFYLGAMQSLFEASMYSFVFLWTPALGPNGEAGGFIDNIHSTNLESTIPFHAFVKCIHP